MKMNEGKIKFQHLYKHYNATEMRIWSVTRNHSFTMFCKKKKIEMKKEKHTRVPKCLQTFWKYIQNIKKVHSPLRFPWLLYVAFFNTSLYFMDEQGRILKLQNKILKRRKNLVLQNQKLRGHSKSWQFR